MKKNLFIILLSLLITSCSNGYYTGDFNCNFINNSSQKVIFVIGEVEYSLDAGQSTVIYKDNKFSVIIKEHPRVKITHDEKKYEFNDIQAKKIHFYNTTNQKVTIGEKKGMLGDTYDTLIEVSPDETVSCDLFTDTPNFYAFFTESNIPVNIELISIF